MSDCPFCLIGRGEVDGDLVAHRSPNVFVVPALMQRANNPGHTLVLPVEHVTGLDTAGPALLGEVFNVTAAVVAGVRAAFGAVGSTIVQNNDAPGQVLHHLHVGVIPRFPDDGYRVPEPALFEGPRSVRAEQAAALRRVLTGPSLG
ncbi:HIT family protein [Streptomyces litchfieldiae]|uniref:HIT family protein n=1 Tax=Streptomyces litchfieldiae TaxID=3075543 RepID=A0ABU2MU61_9ACTN|nr:HIT family protein [Streptomyces sp. DSM 44938]MDT0344109.1 HIT family protein [Streptomyces sp. DSM 44938]